MQQKLELSEHKGIEDIRHKLESLDTVVREMATKIESLHQGKDSYEYLVKMIIDCTGLIIIIRKCTIFAGY